jgi:hypothetical protein
MKIYKINGSLGPHNEVQSLISKLRSAPFAEAREVSTETLEVLGDIVGEALDYNMEDQTIPDRHVAELIGLLEFLEQ